MADVIRVSDWPKLYNTLLIAAFAGWNDAASAATTAVRYIGEHFRAAPFATLDPEDFYVFTQTRPTTKLAEPHRREITWPTNQFSYVSEFAGQNRSLIIMSGVEPDLKWQTFSDAFFEICEKCNVTEVVLLGSLLAPIPHTRPVPLSGYSTDEAVLEVLQKADVGMSRYEGPTGITGVLSAKTRDKKLQNGSLWGAAPTYLSASPNWKVTYRILETLNEGWKLDLNLQNVRKLSTRFETQVSELVNSQEDVASYVRNLEESYDKDDFDPNDFESDEIEEDITASLEEDDSELPSAELLIEELEKQLKLRRSDDPKNS